MTSDNQISAAYEQAADSGRERTAFLWAANVALLIAAVVSLVFQRLVLPEQTIRMVGPLFMVGVALTGLYLLARGKDLAAMYLLVGGSWVGLVLVITLTNGVQAPMVSALPVLILATGWLMGAAAALSLTGLTVAVTVGLALAEEYGLLMLLAETPTSLRAGMQVFVYLLGGVLVFFAMRARKNRESHLRQLHHDLAQRTLDLQASRAELSAALAMSKIGSLVYDFSTDTFHLSEEAGRIYGLPEDSLRNRKPDLNHVHRDDRSRVQQAREAVLQGQSFDIEYRVFVGDDVRHVRSKGAVAFAADGAPLKALATVQDVTERKRSAAAVLAANAQAAQVRGAKAKFLAAVTHDLGQPLAAVALMADMLERSVPGVPQKLVQNLQVCVKQMTVLLSDLMESNKLDAGVALPVVSDWSVQEMLTTVVSVHAAAAHEKGLQLYLRDTDAWTCTDRKLFQRIVGNLVSNAVRYTREGTVMIACRRHAGKRWIEVWDTGIGIPGDKLDGVFDEFSQINPDGSLGGFGLGLSIVAKASQLLGLQVRCRSNLGRGSMFAVELPDECGRVSGPPRERRSVPRGARVGLVEDNVMLLESLTAALQSKGFSVVGATSAADLLAGLADQWPDVVISDFHLLDGETGIDVVDATRAAFGSQLPCLIMTADSGEEHRHTMASRNVPVLQKPMHLDDILAFIEGATCDRVTAEPAPVPGSWCSAGPAPA